MTALGSLLGCHIVQDFLNIRRGDLIHDLLFSFAHFMYFSHTALMTGALWIVNTVSSMDWVLSSASTQRS
ncbi:hypothetical protein HRM2_18230 [Desulforapulum autotrophicum HRM2]|uniref:Uncharacterized protein n=1 Tax=Desulforapulum autotrophicum (strain ATCC 43914 / DSM 3382 / VKM B-1955 / HRM2) TaxID=177437 RepID=C0QBR3_DESAH|nr:hypothetical protein HRM2_18230 [Desulforapulum autotrophicum HRM2]